MIVKKYRYYDGYVVLVLSSLFLISATMVSSSEDMIGGLVGNTIALLSYIIFILIYVYIFKKIELAKLPMIIFGVLYLIFIANFIRDLANAINLPSSYQSPSSIMSILISTGDIIGFVIGSFTLIFLFTKIIERDFFFLILAIISTVSIMVGLPAYIIGDYTIVAINIRTYTSLEPFRQVGIHIPALASVWEDANAMSKVVAAGLFASHYLYNQRSSRVWFILILLHGFGLFIANSKMAMIAVVLSYSIYFLYIYTGKKITTVYLVVSGILGTVSFVLILFGFGTNIIMKVGFSNRVELWRAGIYTFLQHPLFGVGIHSVGDIISSYTSVGPLAPQNSYLRIFVAGGMIGGLMYISINIILVFSYIQKIEYNNDMLVLCLFITFLLVQFTDTADPFGINKNSFIVSIILGYIIRDVFIRYSAAE